MRAYLASYSLHPREAVVNLDIVSRVGNESCETPISCNGFFPNYNRFNLQKLKATTGVIAKEGTVELTLKGGLDSYSSCFYKTDYLSAIVEYTPLV